MSNSPTATDNQMNRKRTSRTGRRLVTGTIGLTLALAGPGLAAGASAQYSPEGTVAPSNTTQIDARSGADSLTQEQVAAAIAEPAIVFIRTTVNARVTDEKGNYFNGGKPYEVNGRCSGFSVTSNGYIATAAHCVDVESGSSLRDRVLANAVNETQAPGFPTVWTDSNGREVSPAVLLKHAQLNWTVEGDGKGTDPGVQVSVVTGQGDDADQHSARIVEHNSFDEGDMALLKVEASDLPVVEIATSDGLRVGEPLLAAGYPAASDDLTDSDSGPTFLDGKITSLRTRSNGLLPVYEISAELGGGMSGGPTVDLTGRVIGVNSFSHAEDSQFNYVQPGSILTELLARAGTSNELSASDEAYRDGLEAFVAGRYSEAVASFDKVLEAAPDHPSVAAFRAEAAALAPAEPPTAPGTPQLSTTTTDVDGLDPAVIVGLIVAGLGGLTIVGGVAITAIVVTRSRRRSGEAAPAPSVPVAPINQVAPNMGHPDTTMLTSRF